MLTSQLSSRISGEASPTGTSSSWLRIEQKEIPEEQQIATIQDFYAGIRQLDAGHPAQTAFSQQCPAKFRTNGQARTVNYNLVFYIHKSSGLEYDVEITLGGELLGYTGPTRALLNQGKPWIIQQNKTQFIGWRPFRGNFTSRWEIAFDSAARLMVTGQPAVEQVDGTIYLLGDSVAGSLWVGGQADADRYSINVSQAVGTSWQGGLYANAYWPAGVPREEQESVAEELFLPECVIEKIEDCPETGGEQRDRDDDGSVDYALAPVYLDIDDCSGDVIGKTPNQ